MIPLLGKKKKKKTLFWIGSANGGFIRPDKAYLKYLRFRLWFWAQNKHTLLEQINVTVDIGFYRTTLAMYDHDFNSSYFINKNLTKRANVFENKYLIVVDGNAFADSFHTYLASRSLVFYAGIFNEWFTSNIYPYIHYIPVSMDFSDLEEKVYWAATHDDQAQQIAENGYNWFNNHGRKEDMVCYATLALLEYHNLLVD